jgi:hypothetical protein
MTTVASSLLEFILTLFTDEEAAARYAQDPQAELDRAGLEGVTPADVDAVKAMETDLAPVSYCGSEDNGGNEGHHTPVWHRDDDDDDHHQDGDHDHRQDHGGHEAAVIKHVENSYNTTNTTNVDVEIEHGVWAGGDAYAIWGDDVVLATGGSVAAGDDVEDVSVDNSVDLDVDIEDSFNDNSTNVHGDGNAVGDGAEVEDSFNTDVDVEDSFNVENSGNTQTGTGNVVGEENAVDNSTDNSTEVELENSFNEIDGNSNNIGEGNQSHDESTDLDVEVEVEDSFNTDNSTQIEDSFTADDSFNTDNSTEIEESFNDNAIAVDEAIANTGDVDVDA